MGKKQARIPTILLSAALLGGCADLTALEGATDVAARAAPAVAGPLIERDVEAPEVFQVTEAGLWDGRPSLGGVWVAFPGVKDPERVLIRNEETGKFVIGALFRRERDNPGPKLQVSSDAASALGLLAGAPGKLTVTALRREEIPAAPPVVATPAVQTIEAPPAVEARTIEAVAGTAAAAIDRASGIAPATSDTPATDAADTVLVAATPPRRGFLARFLAGNAPGEPLSALADNPPTPVAAQAPAPIPVVATPAPARAAVTEKSFIQIGIFSVEANANNTAVALRQDGMVPTIRQSSAKGKPYWRVLVGGPATTAADRAALLKKVRALGFADAYAVPG